MAARIFVLIGIAGFIGLTVLCLRQRRAAAHQDPRLYRTEDVSYYTFATGLMATGAAFFTAVLIWGMP